MTNIIRACNLLVFVNIMLQHFHGRNTQMINHLEVVLF
jgi:hypothetical protein